MMGNYKVVIIGAGVAGCAAAKTLVEKGIHNIVVLEATDRIGGRVKTISHGSDKGNERLELGAQWIHGDVGNPLYRELNDMSLIEHRGEYLSWDAFTADNKYLHPLGQVKVSQSTFQRGFELYSLVNEQLVRAQYSGEDLKWFKRNQFEELCEGQGLNSSSRNLYWKLVRWMYNVDRCVDGDDGFPAPATPFHSFDDCGGKNYVFTQGADSIFNKLLLPAMGDKIQLCSHVTSVEWGQHGTVRVHTSAGQLLSADHVIVTPSLGYIKRHHKKLFHSSLPADKVDAIDKLRIGSVEKLLLCFDSPFWSADVKDRAGFAGYGFLADEEEETQLRRFIGPVIGKQSKWWKQLVSLDTVSTNPNALVGWLAGNSAIESTECSDIEIVKVILTLLQLYTGLQPAVASTRLYRGKWAKDEHFLGSYSIPTDPALSAAMMEPIYCNGSPAIFFAGEAYHHKWMSTLHGAYDTGIQQANVISNWKMSQ